MEFLRQLFSSRVYRIGSTTTGSQRAGSVLIFSACLLVLVVSLTSADHWSPVAVVATLPILLPLGKSLFQSSAGHKTLAKRQYIGHTTAAGSQLEGSVLKYGMGQSQYSSNVIVRDEGWEIYDLTYLPVGTSSDTMHCYTIFEAALIRNSPHLVFDAKLARGRQFKSQYAEAQRLSLEGEFDTYFDTYSPEHYTIDTVSFVSPEVMQALLALKEYDIELLHNRLLVYAPLLAEAEVESFMLLGKSLAKELNDNLSRYRDSYIPARQSTKHIMPFARLLLVNPWSGTWLSVLGSIAATGYWTLLDHTVDSIFALSITLIVIAGFAAFKVFRGIKRNAQAKKAFYADLHTMQARGRY